MPSHDIDRADPLLGLQGREGGAWRAFIVPDARLMYMQVNKNACTSLKWMIAGVAGEDLDGFRPSIEEASTNRWDDIHDRNQWRHAPRVTDLDPALRREIHPDNGWFVFAVTRDPRSRLFSAWQSKLLLNNPGYQTSTWRSWYPRHPVTAQTAVEDFERFVRLFEEEPSIGLRRDGHFRDQVEMLNEDLVPYSKIYDIRELKQLIEDLRKHLADVGWSGELNLPRFNDTPLRANAAVFADGVRERVEAIYRADFERFGDRWDFATIEAVPAWTDAQIDKVNADAELGHRLGLMRRARLDAQADATAATRRADAATKRADAATKEVRVLRKQLRTAGVGLPWRAHLRHDVQRVRDGVKRRIRRRLGAEP